MRNSLVICVGDQITDAHLGIKHFVKGVDFTSQFFLRVASGKSTIKLPIDQVSDSRGNQLLPGHDYKVSKCSRGGKSSIVISPVGKRNDFNIRLSGSGNAKVGKGKVLSEINQVFKRETGYILGNVPEELRFSVGDTVRMRADWATWEDQETIQDIEMIGKEGVIEEILTGNSTVKINFHGVKKNYRLIRLVDVNGNTFEYGWRYMIKKEHDTMIAKPHRKCERDKIWWSGNLKAT